MADPDGLNRPLTHGKDLTEFLDQYGVTLPDRGQALEVNRGVQLVVPVDEARHLTRPLTTPAGIYYCSQAAPGGGNYACVQVTTTAQNGCWIVDVIPFDTGLYGTTQTLGTFNFVAFQLPGVVPSDQGQPLSTVVSEGFLNPAAGTQRVRFSATTSNGCSFTPFWIPGGSTLQLFNATADAQMRLNISLQEVP